MRASFTRRNDDGHDLAAEPHPVAGHDRADEVVGHRERHGAAYVTEVGCSENRDDSVGAPRVCGFDRADVRVGNGGAHERHLERVDVDVAGVTSRAGHQGTVFDPADALADHSHVVVTR